MGPHFFKCGKRPHHIVIDMSKFSFNGAALFQVRKATHPPSPSSTTHWLQWGRTFSSAESAPNSQRWLTGAPLQWGRTFSSAESRRDISRPAQRPKASMGPHFFKCGKRPRRLQINILLVLLQWGRTFSSAERPKVRSFSLQPCFASMGPHFFKCGKLRR